MCTLNTHVHTHTGHLALARHARTLLMCMQYALLSTHMQDLMCTQDATLLMCAHTLPSTVSTCAHTQDMAGRLMSSSAKRHFNLKVS
jgi:hypothetical protein